MRNIKSEIQREVSVLRDFIRCEFNKIPYVKKLIRECNDFECARNYWMDRAEELEREKMILKGERDSILSELIEIESIACYMIENPHMTFEDGVGRKYIAMKRERIEEFRCRELEIRDQVRAGVTRVVVVRREENV